MEDNEKLERNLKLLEKKMHAKKAILKEVLRTIETEKDKIGSVKGRKYIRDMLNCEISIPPTENTCCSLEFLESFRFEMHVITRFRISNRMPDNDLMIRVSALGFTARSILFGDGVDTLQSVGSNSTALLIVAIPFSAFFENNLVPVMIKSQQVPSKNQLFHPIVYTIVGANQAPESLKEAVFALRVDNEKAAESMDLKSIEYCEEQKATQIVQSLLTVSSVLPIPQSIDISVFRREFPRFSCIDFDNWRLFVGTEQFENVFVYIPTEGESRVMGRSSETTRMFLHVLERKCTN